MKVCRDCKLEKDISELCPDKRCSLGVKALCKSCAAIRMQLQRKKPHSKHKENKRKANQRLRARVLAAYGDRCKICGEQHKEFLAIDHVNNDGAEHKRVLSKTNKFVDGYTVYRDIIKQGFPNAFQILCHNCNVVKQTHKYNPILIEREQLEQTEGYYGEGI